MTHTKLLVSYMLLVGVPLLVLIGILHAGQRLTPPLSVAGPWHLDVNFGGLTDATCRDLLSGIAQPLLSIAQSGASLTFTLNDSKKTTLMGTLRDIRVNMDTQAGAGLCSNSGALHLEGSIGTEAGQRVLRGLLVIEGCSQCSPVPFRAVRLTPDHKENQ